MTWNLLTFIASFPSKSATHHTLVQTLKTTYSSLQTQYPRKPPCFVLTTPSFSKYNSSLRTQLMHNSPKKTSQMLPFPSRLGQALSLERLARSFSSDHQLLCRCGWISKRAEKMGPRPSEWFPWQKLAKWHNRNVQSQVPPLGLSLISRCSFSCLWL